MIRKPIALIDVTEFEPDNRDAPLDGDGSILTRFEPSPSHIGAVTTTVHPDRRVGWDELADLDDEAIERLERRRELEEWRRTQVEAERAQMEAIQAVREELPPAGSNA